MKPAILAISGFKNSGKTTLITELLPRLTEYGIKVATVKHDGHEFELDGEGTDTYKHLKAGAMGTAIFSENKYMIINQVKVNEKELFRAFDYVDLILLEGFKYSQYPKIELVKKGQLPIGEHVLAIGYEEGYNMEKIQGVPYISRNNIEDMVEVILEHINRRSE